MRGSPKPVVRAATVADLEELLRMRAALAASMASDNEHLWPAALEGFDRRYAEWIVDPTCWLLVATIEASIVGMAVGRIQRIPSVDLPSFGAIDDVWVDPEHRRQGIAKALVSEILAFFRERNIAEITLAWAHGSAAARVWQHLGFEPVLVTANTKLEELAKKLEGSTPNQ